MKYLIIIFIAVSVLTLSACDQTIVSDIAPQDSNKTADHAEPFSENDGLLWYNAWNCSVYAQLSNNPEEQERLFELGYKVGTGFLKRAKDETMDPEEWKKAPIGITWEIKGGPSIDFILGGLFHSISDYAYNTVVKKDANGVEFDDVLKWRDEEIREIYSETLFRKANCELLR